MNQLAITLIFTLLPGIVAAVILDKLVFHQRWNSFRFTLYSLLLGLISYMSLQVFYWIYDIATSCSFSSGAWTSLTFWDSVVSEKPQIDKKEVFLVTAISVPVAFIVAWAINQKLLNKLAQRIRVSAKYGDENLYSYFLNAEEIDWVYIRDIENDLTYEGRVVSYSESENTHEIVLSEVKVYRYSDSSELYEMPKMYISRDFGKLIIESPA